MNECNIFPAGSRQHDICSGTSGLSKQKTDNFRKRHGLLPLFNEVRIQETKEIEFIDHGRSVQEVLQNGIPIYGPGSELLEIYRQAKVPHCDACDLLAKKMNGWKVEGCREHFKEIVDEIVPRALIWIADKQPWMTKLTPKIVLEAGVRLKLSSDVTKAINKAEKTIESKQAAAVKRRTRLRTHSSKSGGCSSCGGGKNRSFTSAFKAQGKPIFVKSSQQQEDIKILMSKIPHDVTAIAGVARSGMSVATMISMYLHLPLLTIRQNSGDIQATGNGWRLGEKKHVDPKTDKVLIIDDTVMTGNSLKAIAPLVQREFGNSMSGAVYVNPLAKVKPDIWAVNLAWPHLLEWNLFNSVLSPNMATDFDGVLCHDCPPEQDDDGKKYIDFIENAKPLYISRKATIPLIVTARTEKYRPQTEAWLKKWGISFRKLVMHPAKTLAERNRDDIPAYKAKHFQAWAKTHRASPPPLGFIESDDRQAKRIAKLTGLMVISPHAGKVY